MTVMNHFSRRLAEILGSRKRQSRQDIARHEAQRALEQTRPAREKLRAAMLRAGQR